MKFLIPLERQPAELRVAATPETIERLLELGHSAVVESGAGRAASFPDAAMREAGAEIVQEISWSGAEALLRVGPLTAEDADQLPERLDPARSALERLEGAPLAPHGGRRAQDDSP